MSATPAQDREAFLLTNIRALLTAIGAFARCEGCGAAIWFVMTNRGRRAPYTEEALNHFANCPKASEFRRPKPAPRGGA